ncbi:hypothetical protein GCM10017764_27460 [Sphingobacterium griseoflavum]|uniref:DUF4440 domain-containing protein n=2 Tax=Sphingobacterium griseoflavum TaxID=1474952 RepID=A0ABQ3HZA0_9SPHI|nr:hypothetical protein GCM10017764_27460 [Sphingobacterium griseoflavum]
MLAFVLQSGFNTISAQTHAIQRVEKSIDKLVQAMLKPNQALLMELTADSLTYGHSNGKIERKKEFMETLLSGASDFKEIELTDQTIQVVGSTAIVRHVLHAKTDDPGKGSSLIKLGIVLTWIETKGGWQLLARQAYKLP